MHCTEMKRERTIQNTMERNKKNFDWLFLIEQNNYSMEMGDTVFYNRAKLKLS